MRGSGFSFVHQQDGIEPTAEITAALLHAGVSFSVEDIGSGTFAISVDESDEDELHSIASACNASAAPGAADPFHRHEMLDRTFTVSVMLDQLLLRRRDLPSELRVILEDAAELLGEAYQLAGTLTETN